MVKLGYKSFSTRLPNSIPIVLLTVILTIIISNNIANFDFLIETVHAIESPQSQINDNTTMAISNNNNATLLKVVTSVATITNIVKNIGGDRIELQVSFLKE